MPTSGIRWRTIPIPGTDPTAPSPDSSASASRNKVRRQCRRTTTAPPSGLIRPLYSVAGRSRIEQQPKRAFEIDPAVRPERDTLRFEQRTLSGPSGYAAPRSVHDPMARHPGIRIAQRPPYPAGMSRHSDQPGDESVGGHPPRWDLPHDSTDFCGEVRRRPDFRCGRAQRRNDDGRRITARSP